ncbi:MAG: sulfatase family protein [Daejeonella sp.]
MVKHIQLFLLISIFPICLKAQQRSSNQSTRPNIIYILADDLGYGDVSSYNENSRLNTKNIDQLAKEGVLFTDAHTSSSVCTPTRYGILTGRYNWRSNLKESVLNGYSRALIEPERLTVPKLLQTRGYETAFIGKWHLGWNWHFLGDTSGLNLRISKLTAFSDKPDVDFSLPVENGPNVHGFDYSYGISASLNHAPFVYVENGKSTSIPDRITQHVEAKAIWDKGPIGSDFRHVEVLPKLTKKALEYIDEHANKEKPFFLYLPLTAPHDPVVPTPEFMGKSNTNFYGDFVLQVDDLVGQIMALLKKKGIQGETMIIFTSDNGCAPLANYNELASVGHNPSYIFRGTKADIYEGGHRVPFIVSWPNRIKQAFRTNEIICTTDLMATIADIVDFTLPDNAGEDSYSFLPILMKKNLNRPLREATVHHSINGSFAIRQGDWKLILCPGSGGWSFPRTPEELKGLPPFQLYNLKIDPAEKQNIVNEHPKVVKELKSLLTKYIKNGRSTSGKPQKNDGPERWAQIDWIDDNR